jgi:predicted DNA-binding protein with PD1-like motif
VKYQVGSAGRIVVAKFEDGELILDGLRDIAQKEDLRSAVFYLVGGMKAGKFVVGSETEDMPPQQAWRELKESHEVVGLGTIFWRGDEPKVHFHGTFGKLDGVKMGCLREAAEAFIVIEAIIVEIIGVTAIRELDLISGFALLKV